MQCPRCGRNSPAGVKFCGECGTPLDLACPTCRSLNSPTNKFCHQCGALLAGAPTAGRVAPPQDYTPGYLAEKILHGKRALEGERKHVTVLFADLRGSLELLVDRDPEEARKLLDPALERMMEAVHHYEGTVNQVMGDGIMALFGAPLAHEDHAVRACYAALRMQDALARLAEELRQSHGLTVQIRIGLNSGEVVVRSIGSDLRMDYTAVGQTTHLAARVEQLATPGRTFLTDYTRRLVEGYVTLKPLGPVPVKGLVEPVPIYELTGIGPVRSRLQASAARGLTPFVGRGLELAELRRALDRANAGHGQVVAIVGEPGVGKSRLIWEFTRLELPAGWRVLETSALSYGRSTPYLPIVGLLRTYLEIEGGDNGRRIREKVMARILDLDQSLTSALSPLLTLLDVAVDDEQWLALEPSQRRQRSVEAVKRLLFREAQVQPVCLAVEDLQWIDSETQAVLDALVEGLPTARVLLLVSYRPEYQHGWANKTYYRQLRVDPLPPDSAEELLRSLVGDRDGVAALTRLLIDRTEGNPFFLEETIRDLVEAQVLVGERGAYRLAKPPSNIHVPATVQAVLATRVDRLPPEEKALLETAAVIGRDIPFALLEAIGVLPHEELRRSLARLRGAEFLYEVSLFPQPEYTFKHALTLEAVYGSLLQDRRRALHARIVEAMERLYPERLAEHAEILAHHAVRGEVWEKAVDYLRKAGAKAYARGALLETVERYEQGLSLMTYLPVTSENTLRAIDIRLDLHAPLLVLGRVRRLMEVGEEAERLARQLNDSPRLGRVLQQLGYFFWLSARYGQSLDYGRQALDIATTLGNPTLRIRATHLLGLSRLSLGDYPSAVELLTRVVDGPDADLARSRLSLLVSYVDACGWLAFCLAAIGDFDRSLAYADRAVQLADASGHPQPQAMAYGFRAIPLIVKGDFSLALPWCERAGHVSQTKAVLAWIPTAYSLRGLTLAWLGHHADGLAYLEQAAKAREQMGVTTNLALFHFRWAEGLLLAKRIPEARRAAQRALELAVSPGERGYQALTLYLLADIAAAADPPDTPTAFAHVEQAKALAKELGMRPALARCHLSLGRLLAASGRPAEARAEFSTAIGMFASMGMAFWLGRAQAELDKVSR
ncbi:MAG: AAA family ATPase [Candidatus Rokubacteria bacterium]|nr:AAA family ATPase [Candidatus Rokubacteria bacterium]